MKKKMLQYISLLLFLTYFLNLCAPCFPVQAEAISAPVALAETGSASDSLTEANHSASEATALTEEAASDFLTETGSSADFTEGEATLASSEESLTENASFSDIAGHWAEKGIKAWTTRELANGYPDGTFRPDSPITRAEFFTLVNRAFGYMVAGQATYRDVAETDWYAGEIIKAAAVGYLGGYPDDTIKPQNPITRQEAAALFAKILPPANFGKDKNKDSNNDIVDSLSDTKVKFADQAQIPAWSQAAIAAAVSGGYMNGYPDGTFQPIRPITRAEAISVLDRAVGTLYNHVGTYGSSSQGTTLLEGNVTINTAGITLQNTTITGNLYLTEGIGEGDVTLNNVTVQGTTKISGGGSNSIHLLNTTVGSVLVNVPSRNLVRLLAQGSTAVGTLEARTPAILEEEGLTGSGFTKVIINTQQAILSQGSTPPQEGTGTQENTGTENNTPVQGNTSSQEIEQGIIVELLGQFNEVEVQSAATQLDLQKGSIANLTLASTAQAAQINLATQTSINTLTADTPATVQGQGAIERIEANADGVVVEAPAKNVILEDGVQATVEGKTITESIVGAEIKKKKSRDAALSDLTIDRTTVTGFAPDTLFYEVVVSHGTLETNVPNVEATAHHAKARVTVTKATGLTAPNNTATVLVTAENGSTQTYKVNFVKATVSGIAVKTAPTKTAYIEGDLLDLTGLVITLIRTDKSIEEIAFAEFEDNGISTSPADGTMLSPANNKVTITHTASGKSVEQDITVTPTYTVTVAAVSGGTAEVTVDKPKAKAGDTVTVSITNLESGKKFKAISVTSASGDVLTTEVTAGEKYTFTMPAEAVTVTVELEAITYTLTYTAGENGSITGETSQTVNHGKDGTAVTAVPVTNYHLVEWSDGKIANPRTDTNVTENITVTANFAIDTYTVTFKDHDEEVLKTETVEHGSNATAPANPTREGYTFTGWNGDFTTVTADLTVTAHYTINSYTVTFDKNGGNKEAEPSTMTNVTHGSAVGTLPIAPTRDGYAFAGWNTETDGTGDEFKADTIVTGDITVYAQWEIKVTGVTLNKTEMFLQVGTTATEPLIATVEPSNATNNNVTWSSSDETIATVGTEGVIAEAIGEAEITVTTVDGEHTATCTVNVVDSVPVLDKSCVLYLDGRYGTNDPATQTWYDLSGNNNGTLTNFTDDAGSGWTGQGLEFDGVNDYVDCGSIPALTPSDNFTWNVLCYISDTTMEAGCIIGNRFGGLASPLQFIKLTPARFEYYSETQHGINYVIPRNKFVYITIVKNGSSLYYYCDGKLVASKIDGINFNMAANPFYVGGDKGAPNSQEYFSGAIRNVSLYNRALSPREIMQNYLAGKNSP